MTRRKPPPPTSDAPKTSTLTVVSVVAMVAVAVTVLGGAYWTLDRKIDRVSDWIEKLDGRLRNVEIGIAAIQTELKYRPRAAALGFKDPDIKLVSLASSRTFTFSSEIKPGVDSNLAFTIMELSDDRVEIRVDGRIGSMIFEDHRVSVPLKPGELTPIRFISAPGVPVIYIAILDRPTPRDAVIAVGQVASTPSG